MVRAILLELDIKTFLYSGTSIRTAKYPSVRRRLCRIGKLSDWQSRIIQVKFQCKQPSTQRFCFGSGGSTVVLSRDDETFRMVRASYTASDAFFKVKLKVIGNIPVNTEAGSLLKVV